MGKEHFQNHGFARIDFTQVSPGGYGAGGGSPAGAPSGGGGGCGSGGQTHHQPILSGTSHPYIHPK